MGVIEEMNLERCRRDLAELAKFPIGAKVRVIGPYACDWPGEYIVVGAQYDHRSPPRFNIWIATEEEIGHGYGASTDLTPDELCVVDPSEKSVSKPCPTCEGGKVHLSRTQCPTCHGAGQVDR